MGYYFCSQFLGRFPCDLEPAEPQIEDDSYKAATFLITHLDQHREIARFGKSSQAYHLSEVRGAVLIFLPGLHEIEVMHKHLL